jgi:hypothetical protein
LADHRRVQGGLCCLSAQLVDTCLDGFAFAFGAFDLGFELLRLPTNRTLRQFGMTANSSLDLWTKPLARPSRGVCGDNLKETPLAPAQRPPSLRDAPDLLWTELQQERGTGCRGVVVAAGETLVTRSTADRQDQATLGGYAAGSQLDEAIADRDFGGC